MLHILFHISYPDICNIYQKSSKHPWIPWISFCPALPTLPRAKCGLPEEFDLDVDLEDLEKRWLLIAFVKGVGHNKG